jgi:hypothetical protein
VAPVVRLDLDLPVPETGSGVRGFDELATINRAAGLLIERGHDPESVLETLRARASSAGLSAVRWSERMLGAR